MNDKPKDSTNEGPKGEHSSAAGERPVIVAALGRLGLSIVRLLRAQGRTVRVITEAGCPSWHVRAARELGAEMFMGDFRDPEIWSAAGVQDCQAAMITSADDSRNLETSIRVKFLAPKTRIITRVDAPHLGHRLQQDFDLNAALCPATLSAGHFVELALVASSKRSENAKSQRLEPRHRPPWQSLVLFILAGCLAAGTFVFHFAKSMPWIDATYFTMTILTTVGFGDYHLHHDPAWLKVFGMVLMLAGISLIALLVSLFSHFLITGEASRQQRERAARRMDRHVIVAGMGSLGLAVMKELQERGIPTVCIELDANRLEGAPRLKQSVPWIEGDATGAETLLRAGIDRARALLAVTSADGTNLEIALRARSLTDQRSTDAPLPVILTCQDELLASRLRDANNAYIPLSAADLAAPVFVKAGWLRMMTNRDRQPFERVRCWASARLSRRRVSCESRSSGLWFPTECTSPATLIQHYVCRL